MENLKVFPDGLNDALTRLMKILADSPHGFRIEVSRYHREPAYQAKIEITDLATAAIVVRGDE